jgi:SAM-dependent methyltransferase
MFSNLKNKYEQYLFFLTESKTIDATQLNDPPDIYYYIDEFNVYNGVLFIKGWVYASEGDVVGIGFENNNKNIEYIKYKKHSSLDVVNVHGKIARDSRYSLNIYDNLPEDLLNLVLVFQVSGNSNNILYKVSDLWKFGVDRGPYGDFIPKFFERYIANSKRTKILEIGSRARSGVNNRDTYIKKEVDFVGVDVLDGECVDIVCDAHELSSKVNNNYFDCVYSLNVFEHILMPWKVVLEINKVLKTDGIVMIFTHHAFPLHDLPWDYWRFSDNAWHGLFNKQTGFEVIETILLQLFPSQCMREL